MRNPRNRRFIMLIPLLSMALNLHAIKDTQLAPVEIDGSGDDFVQAHIDARMDFITSMQGDFKEESAGIETESADLVDKPSFSKSAKKLAGYIKEGIKPLNLNGAIVLYYLDMLEAYKKADKAQMAADRESVRIRKARASSKDLKEGDEELLAAKKHHDGTVEAVKRVRVAVASIEILLLRNGTAEISRAVNSKNYNGPRPLDGPLHLTTDEGTDYVSIDRCDVDPDACMKIERHEKVMP